MTAISRIISGGQTGADQAGLAAAKRLGIATGGYMPMGWLTEQGPRPDLAAEYGLIEALTAAYPDRTERNVLEADATVIFGDERSAGSMLTAELCRQHGKPWLTFAPGADPATAASELRAWLRRHRIETLNVAGNRGSQAPGIDRLIADVLTRALATPQL